MSHRRKLIPLLVLLVGAFIAYKKATADKGGTFDPDRPEIR